ncbi:MAG: hypothetical protein EAZ65_00515 [Verrucomicrobia bacterium]|nr:MAG: hypothetical protein EAZ84_12875 [Verrucomicrobiota bacterium]TAE89304.1 MAG: hypothetical protein EAZ82_01380 [Verrucomicrobiota bacterium]TAF27822.1 MAG: hypothetical protein EAZ71_00520 [Verrucomicrobiota bacterium]TAF42671.1 MAG: hypothetical protein EAZ65_00515 [Verrucomicrobiota bacterium]
MPSTHAHSRLASDSDLHASFLRPPASHGPVPFYWWAGETLDRDRIAWQLDQLREKGVRQTVISYPHNPDGSNDPGDPKLFSPAWWDLFRWFLGASRERGMHTGFQDYTLVEPILKAIGRDTPGMQGGQLSCVAATAKDGSTIQLAAEPATHIVGAWAYPIENGTVVIDSPLSLSNTIENGALHWSAPAGDWFVALVFARLNSFDPLHPDSGTLAIEKLYAPFERECPGEVGKTLNLFFQDELDFGCRMPFWSNHLLDTFASAKGYDLAPLLPALWHDLGPRTEKIRLDFADLVSARAEECYFKPIFEWHETRGTTFGHDNCGRGRIAQGRAHYGDYFRAMRWYSAPGCDDPKLQGARAFKGLKVNSSIAHLYQRPRVWIEAFHSSGWGTTPADVVAAIQEDFAYGATVVNLHGLYYSTLGGWWEWAPPDFHFRQPYWQHGKSLNDWFTRLSWILSQGVRRCDVAIVYPIAALDAEPADPAINAIIAHVANESLGGEESRDPQPEDSAFNLGKHLFDRNCDFDFIDFESLERATPTDAALHVAGSAYRVLLLPAMAAVRFSTLEKARDFVRAGGLVIAYGRLPTASDRAGREDPVLDALVSEIFGSSSESSALTKSHPGGGKALFIPFGRDKVLDAIDASIDRDLISTTPLQVLHRHLGDKELFYLFNPAAHPVTTALKPRDHGEAELWNAWTGDIEPARLDLPLTFAARESKLLVIHHREDLNSIPQPAPADSSLLDTLDGPWEFLAHPTLDNRFGDFSLPPTDELLGAQARRFRHADAFDDDSSWTAADFDDSSWPETTFSFGPRLEFIGPFPPDSDLTEIENWLVQGGPEPADRPAWQSYAFSLRYGIERDPFLTDWLSGPHGLKGTVPDEFLDFLDETPGSVWFLRTCIHSPTSRETIFEMGGRCAYRAWFNGRETLAQDHALPPGAYAPWNIPHYECEPRTTKASLHAGDNSLLIRLVQPAGQRTRAFFRFSDAPAPELSLRGFSDPHAPRPTLPASPDRRGIRFRFDSPPGFQSARITTRGPARLWLDGQPLPLETLSVSDDGIHQHRCHLPAPLAKCAALALHVDAPAESRAGDALPEPVRFDCGQGIIDLGDWCQHGLASYSGAATYSCDFTVTDATPRITLDLGELNATAEIHINGQLAATLIAPPWTCELGPFVKPGTNRLAVTVANTLANHYSVGNPSPYAFEHQTPSGLFGPVRLFATP